MPMRTIELHEMREEPILRSGHAACPGCIDALSVRHVLAALGPDTVNSLPRTCSSTWGNFSTTCSTAVRAWSGVTPSAMRAPAKKSFLIDGLPASNVEMSTIQLVLVVDASSKMPRTVRVWVLPFFHTTSTGSPTCAGR